MIQNPIIEDIKSLINQAVKEQALKHSWYDVENACFYAKCSRTTLFKAIRDENLKSAKPKGVNSLKFRRDWLDRWLNG